MAPSGVGPSSPAAKQDLLWEPGPCSPAGTAQPTARPSSSSSGADRITEASDFSFPQTPTSSKPPPNFLHPARPELLLQYCKPVSVLLPAGTRPSPKQKLRKHQLHQADSSSAHQPPALAARATGRGGLWMAMSPCPRGAFSPVQGVCEQVKWTRSGHLQDR